MVLSDTHLCVLGCQCYIHDPDINMHHRMNNREWKDIMVGYNRVKQSNIYNPRTRRIHVSASVRYVKSFNYYDTSHEIADEYVNGDELGDVWNEADDEKFGKRMTKRQAMGSNAKSAYPTSKLHSGSVVANNKEEGDNNSLPKLAIDNDHPLSNQPMPPPAIPSEIVFFD